jgi:predicted ATPase
MSLKFSSIQINSWRQYKSIDIDFHPRLTVITGPNGTGKSTILSILSRHFGYQKNYLSTPKKNKKTGIVSFSTGIFSWWSSKKLPSEVQSKEVVGNIAYSDDVRLEIRVPNQNSMQYGIDIPGQKPVNGIHIDSHRPPNVYRPVPNISTALISKANISQQLNGELQQFYTSGKSQNGTLFHMKSALISMSMFGHGNSTMEPNQDLIDLFDGFEEKLRIILPKSLGFEKIIIRVPEVILSTRSGEFVLDAASGGVIKLFEIAWQIYFHSQQFDKFVVTLDEPENHLHPSMQRTFLSNLLKAFPGGQFVVVTHSPFVVSSVKDSSVYVLRYEDIDEIVDHVHDGDQSVKGLLGSRVSSEKLDTVNKAGTASEILREALGVPTTIPDWAEDRVRQIIDEYARGDRTNKAFDQLAAQLENEGLVSHFPEALRELTKKND